VRASARLRLGLRAALRRRRSLRAAIARHQLGELGAEPYDGATEGEALFRGYWSALQRLRRRWPGLDLEDERGRP